MPSPLYSPTRQSPNNTKKPVNESLNTSSYFFYDALTPFRVMAYPLWVSRSLPLDTPHLVGLLWTSDQHQQTTLPDNTLHSQQTDIQAPGGNRTRKPSKQAAADPRLRRSVH
jgi:hypothetical protein